MHEDPEHFQKWLLKVSDGFQNLCQTGLGGPSQLPVGVPWGLRMFNKTNMPTCIVEKRQQNEIEDDRRGTHAETRTVKFVPRSWDCFGT